MKVRDFNVWKALHDAIHLELIGEHRQSIRKFVGVERLCKDCEDCLAIAKIAEEYGPIKLRNLRRLEKVEHPRKLIITSQLLDHIAIECVSNFVSKEECFERLDNIIKPDLSRDTLILWLSESQKKRGNTGLRNHFHIPLEILEMLIRKWCIKHLRIHFVFEGYNTIHMDYWMDTEYFTAFRFNDREDFVVREPRMKLDSIEVDLIDSFYCRRDFARVSAAGDRGYSNLLVNIQKVFSTNLISIKNLFKSSLELPEVHIAFRRILKILSKSGRIQIDCKEPVLTVNFEHLILIPDFLEFSSNAEQGNVTYFDVPEEFSNSKSPSFFVSRRPPLEPIYSPKGVMNMKFIGKKYVIEHNGVVFNLGIFLNETAVNQETTNRNVKEFLNFFV
ncbi:hypothetical protein CAEBREN_10872 [Caenorhabditis brenneri]|uniref:Uncharacterized protein n=1 Tax=Caenorhabditis brenneri TaxID=135651 RepID=G0PHS4_CAEBE|nr:hypothetical protein CAEBREN_10872 [Caenorhabditis brenneri]